MNWTDDPKKVSEFICLLMGKINPEVQWDGENKYYDAFTPDGIFAWKAYMEKELPEVWEEYCRVAFWFGDASYNGSLKMQLDPSKFARWMEANMELWGYVECSPDNNETCFSDGCQKFNKKYSGKGICKIINPKFQKAVELIEKYRGEK